MNFGEKEREYSKRSSSDIPVWQSPKYLESKKKAEEIISSKKYGVEESDFWILMNETRNGKMAYTGLIISHNGCLKINDCLGSKFDPSCVNIDKDGYKGSLVYTYCNPAQGIYEVGEVSASNCKNDYPYAMAYKRMFDRVVLKLSKLAYAGIYSDSEADEFAQRLEAAEPEQKPKAEQISCERCNTALYPVKKKDGTIWEPAEMAQYSKRLFGRCLCASCMKVVQKETANAGR